MASQCVLWLPGAGGEGGFWRPVADLVRHPANNVLFDWPGFGPNPPRTDVTSADELYRLVEAHVDRPVDIVAQSMGGLFALRAALDHPDLVQRLVLVATSGGVQAVREAAAVDWRPGCTARYPGAPGWAVDVRTDGSPRLSELSLPVLLLWGAADAISPPAAGRKLLALLPNARLHIVDGGDHAFAHDRATEVAPIVRAFLLD
jgi:pimeloyl-ACP methyl ester carboxylesterase